VEPLVAVLIPVHGEAGPLRSTLDSLLNANLPSRICTLVVDDGSEPPLEADAVRYASIGLRLERLPRNAGIEAALNRGLERARELGAAYVARLDAGDTAHADRLTKQLALLEGDRDLGIVASDVRFVDEAGRLVFVFEAPRTDGEVRRRMSINCCLIHPSVMLRMSVLDEVGPYSTRYPAAEDYELFFRLLGRARAASIAEPLTTSVVSRDGITVAKRRMQLASRLRIQWRYFDPGRPESYAGIALTLLFFVLPYRLLGFLKRVAGRSRY
jgi:glycosyltransferase involved in cell wall biosynthesis